MDRKTINHFGLRIRNAATWLTFACVFFAETCASRRYTSRNDFGTPQVNELFETPTRVTIGNESNFSPTLSPNGAYMFYTSDRNGNKDIFAKKTRGGYATPVTNHPSDDFSPVMSPNGKYLAFVSRRSNAAGAIHIMEMGASASNLGGLIEPELITINLRELENRNPAWFPNNKKIIFSAREMGSKEPRLYIASVDKDPNLTQLADIRGDYPTVSPDGNKVAYSRQGRIYYYDLENNQEIQLTDGSMGQDGHPSFSGDSKRILFIRYADDTNRDGQLTPEDRPTIWSLDYSNQPENGSSLETFRIMPLTSSSRSAFYPKIYSPYLYFASEDSDSLDIYRLPDFGHVKDQASIQDTIRAFERVQDDDDKLFILRRASAVSATRGDVRQVGELALKELSWLIEIGRTIEAKNLRSKIARELRNELAIQAIADLTMISSELAPFRYPDPDETKPENFDELAARWSNTIKKIIEAFPEGLPDTPTVRSSADLVTSEIFATSGKIDNAVFLLKSMEKRYGSDNYNSAKALAYLLRIEVARGQFENAIGTLIKIEKQFPSEITIINSAAIDLTTSIRPDDPDAIRKLTNVIKQADHLVLVKAYARQRIAEIYDSQGKTEAANSEYRSILKDSGAPSHICLESAKLLTRRMESSGSFSVVRAIYEDLRSALHNSNIDEKYYAAEMEAEFYVRRGRVLLNEGESLLALREFQRSAEISPNNISAQEGIIDVADIQEKISETVEFKRTLVNLTPRDPIRLYLLAYSIQKQKTNSRRQRALIVNESIEILENARQINGQIQQFHKLLGKLYLEKAHASRADSLDRSGWGRVNQAWTNTKSFFGFSDPNWFELSIDSSLTAYFLASENSNDKADLALQLANTYFENQTFILSLRHYLRRITSLSTQPITDPKDEMRLFRHAGRAAFFSDELQIAEALQRKSLQLAVSHGSQVDQAYATDALALSLREQKKFDEARIAYSRLLEMQTKLSNKSNLITTRLNIAYCFMMAGKAREALEQYDKAENILNELKTEDSLKPSDKILIDISGENSATRGFTALDQKIQISSFRAQIQEGRGELKLTYNELIEKIELLTDKKTRAKKFGFGDTFLAEELSIAHNNAGYIAANLSNLGDAVTHFNTALGFARKLRSKNQEFAARPEWINLLDLARAQLRRADLQTLPKPEQEDLENQLNKAIAEFEKPVQNGNRDAILASAALNSVSAQLLSSESVTSDSRKSIAQARFQQSILLSHKIGLELPFVSSANLNLDREAAAASPNRDDILSSHIEFRRSAVSRPGLAWKYLATRGLCIQAIEALTAHVSSGGRLLENDAALMRSCIDTELLKNDLADTTKFKLIRQYYYIMSHIIIRGRQGESTSQINNQILDVFRLGKLERVGAALNDGEIMLVIYSHSDGGSSIVITSSAGMEQIKNVKNNSTNGLSHKVINASLLENIKEKKLRRIYVIADDENSYKAILGLVKLNTDLTISFLPTPDFLPNIAVERQMHFDAKIISDSDASKFFWRGYIEQIASGDLSPQLLNPFTTSVDNDKIQTQYYEAPLEEVSRDLFHQAVIVGYPGLNERIAHENSQKNFQRAYREAELFSKTGDMDMAYLRARESFYYAWLNGNKDMQYQAASFAYQSALGSTRKTDLVYFLNMQRHFAEELNKGQSALKDIEAAEIQQKNGKIDDAERIINKVLNSKNAKSLHPQHLAKSYELIGRISQQRRKFASSIESLTTAKDLYERSQEFAKAALCELRIAKIFAHELFDFESAKLHLRRASQLSLRSENHSVTVEIKLATARIMIQSHDESQAQALLSKLVQDEGSGLAATELVEVYLTMAESLYWQSKLHEAKTKLTEGLKQVGRIKSVSSSQIYKIRAGNLRAMILAAEGKRTESLGLFNALILQAIEGKHQLLERDLRHNLAHWHRQWDDYSKAAPMYESAIKINRELSAIDPQLLPFELTETANLALTLALGGKLEEGKSLLASIFRNDLIKSVSYAHAFALLVQADLYFLSKDLDQAEESLVQALQITEKFSIRNLNWRSHFGLGLVTLQKGLPNNAERHFESAYKYVEETAIGVQRAEFSSYTIAQASGKFLHESYVRTLLDLGKRRLGFDIAAKYEMRLVLDDLGIIIPVSDDIISNFAKLTTTDGPLVWYFLGDTHGFAAVNRDGKTDIFRLKNTNNDIKKMADDYLLSSNEQREKILDNMSDALITPIQSTLRDAKIIQIMATHNLSTIPFAALKLSDKYLIESSNISLIPMTMNTILKEKISSDPRFMKVLGLISPRDKKSIFAKEKQILPRFYPDAQILSEDLLSLDRIKSTVQDKEILHISGQFTPNFGDLRHSKVSFSSSRADINALFIKDVANSIKNLQLAFISQPSAANLISTALFAGGTQSVVANEAPSFDTDAIFLAKNFYKNYLKSGNACSALREAQLASIKYLPSSRTWSFFKAYGPCHTLQSTKTSRADSNAD